MNTPPDPITILQRISLAQEIYNLALDHSESFREQNIGADLAYLLGAIIDPVEETSFVDWRTFMRGEAGLPNCKLLDIIQNFCPPDHAVWQFIQRDPPLPVKSSPPPPANERGDVVWGVPNRVECPDLPPFNPAGKSADSDDATDTNKETADHADAALKAWRSYRGRREDPESDYQDLAADLCHAMHRAGQDPREVFRIALNHWWAEATGQ